MLSSCQKDRQTDCSSFVWLHGNINLQASELHVTPTTVIRGPGSGSFDPNTRLTAHAAKEEINPFPRREEIELFFFFFPGSFLHFWFPLHVGSYFPAGSDDKESACNAGDLSLIPRWEDPLKKEMATYSSILARRIPWTVEPGRLQSTGSHRVRLD